MPTGQYKRKLVSDITREKHRKFMLTDKNPSKKLENRQKRKEAMIGDKNPSKRPEVKKKNSEWQIANPNRKFKETGIEVKVENELKERNIKYTKQVQLCKVAVVDFLLTDYGIAIQVDGCYYHNCPIHHPDKYIGRRDRDFKQDQVLISNGYMVYRFWEHDINESVEECINGIKL